MDQKFAYSLQNAEINEKVSRKFGYVRFFFVPLHAESAKI